MRKCDCCGKLFDKDEKKFKSPIEKYDYLCFVCVNNVLVSIDTKRYPDSECIKDE